ncbi:polyprenyl synthetase family protein [Antrihabitans stalactiti]|uniref:Polyprenyl synthetase family protein n=1 Tax=Antrihabitans stalactiti TaxID=2584121 RepID=A0A848KJY0_9NOCA|nr:polyprenyl synthetase family protein [Antrihabitans stalactiti]NMN96167.1 polyprenyl synthetase family protein [Antrihabitans stalactiti]
MSVRTFESGPSPISPNQSMISDFDFGDTALADDIQQQLGQTEHAIVRELSCGEPALEEPMMHLTTSGGKRFRPLLALLSSQFGPRPGCSAVIDAAAAVELVHMASLYHDDVMDEATMRRGVESVNLRWNNSVAILAGDYMLVRAWSVLTRSQLDPVLKVSALTTLSESATALVTGQLRETVQSREGIIEPEQYLQTVTEKTASLLSIAAWLGAAYSGADETVAKTLSAIGEAIGIVFQISDDIIDVAAPSDRSGKSRCTDLREGVATLPVIYALRDGAATTRLRELVSRPITDDNEVEEAVQLIQSSSAFAESRAMMERYAALAHSHLATLQPGVARQAIGNLIDFTLARSN